MDRYIIINGLTKPFMVPILASKDNNYVLSIGKGRGNKISLPPSAERYLIYKFYWGGVGGFSQYLHNYKRNGFSPMEIDKAVEVFKSDHPSTEVENFDFKNLPLYAEDEGGLELILPSGICVLPAEYEKKFMQLLIDEPYQNTFRKLKSEFSVFRSRYSLDYNRKWLDQDEELANEFLHQHGIRTLDNLPLNPEIVKREEERNNKKTKEYRKSFFTKLIIYLALLFLFVYQNAEVEHDSFFGDMFWTLGLVFMIGLPFILLNKLGNDEKK